MIPREAKEEENNKVELSITGIADYVEVRSISIIKGISKVSFLVGIEKRFL